ncbi:MAG: PrsW family intramembrane metalloprotease [Evtepia sp.]|uniref:PrsW family intramembrane metalloprotease n=1 Tax=Evtepia sp. TaxID=2773933 RepID=UPI002A751D40|nr:PrsW family intramembrane metalloprotease [Evtepia sp.]MDY3014303.1 PrsW family intramembrane metalloprotease [Evtepia sp.]
MLFLNSVVFLVAAALLPPLLLLGVVYRMDKLDREPAGLLMSLFFRGVLAMVPILVLELMADQFIDFFPWRPMVYLFLAYFVVPGFIEEGVKYRVLIRRTWQEPNFNFRFDAVVYAVFVSLGFAAVENILYVLTNGFSTAVVRAIFSIPGHAMFGVVMGAGVGRAKWLEAHGQYQQAEAARKNAWLLAAVLHGLYDFLLVAFGWVFYPYFAGLVLYVWNFLRKSAREDGPVAL